MPSIVEVARAFNQARRDYSSIGSYPGEVPQDLTTAYAIQDEAILDWEDQVVGWKVALILPQWRAQYDAPRFAGPIFKRGLVHSGPSSAHIRAIPDGFCAVEAEFAVQLDRDIPTDLPKAASLEPYIRAVHGAIELAAGPLSTINDLGPGAAISDFGNSIGVVVGDKIEAFSWTALEKNLTRISLDGTVVGDGSAARVAGGPLGAVRFLIDHLKDRGRSLHAGNWISTGATSGVHAAKLGSFVQSHFNNGATASLEIQ